MKYREFGNSNFACSEVGLGTWQFGGDWGQLDEQRALEIMRTAYDGGVNFFDTADVYGLGVSESFIGRFLARCEKRPFVATKLGRFPEPGWPENFTYEAFEAFTTASIKRLGVEALDLTQLHCIPTQELRKGEVFEHLRSLKQQGKILAFGVSVESVEEGLMCLEQEGVASLQVIFNIFRQKPAHDLFAAAREKGVAIIARVPLASGLLSGKFHKDMAFAGQDHRSYNKDGEAFNVGETFAGLPFDKGVELVERLQAQLKPNIPLAALALRWILDHDAVTTVIPGASRPEQAQANLMAADLPPLSAEQHQLLAEYYASTIAAFIRGPY